jgi:hypothetical protein
MMTMRRETHGSLVSLMEKRKGDSLFYKSFLMNILFGYAEFCSLSTNYKTSLEVGMVFENPEHD